MYSKSWVCFLIIALTSNVELDRHVSQRSKTNLVFKLFIFLAHVANSLLCTHSGLRKPPHANRGHCPEDSLAL